MIKSVSVCSEIQTFYAGTLKKKKSKPNLAELYSVLNRSKLGNAQEKHLSVL